MPQWIVPYALTLTASTFLTGSNADARFAVVCDLIKALFPCEHSVRKLVDLLFHLMARATKTAFSADCHIPFNMQHSMKITNTSSLGSKNETRKEFVRFDLAPVHL
jgi:hypothetical protein